MVFPLVSSGKDGRRRPGMGFANYVLLKLYGARGIELTGFLGGLVNSTVTVTELTQRARSYDSELAEVTYRGVIFATAAMLIRNAVILGFFAPAVLLDSSIPRADVDRRSGRYWNAAET